MKFDEYFYTENSLIGFFLLVVAIVTIIYFFVPQSEANERIINGGYLLTLFLFGLFTRLKIDRLKAKKNE